MASFFKVNEAYGLSQAIMTSPRKGVCIERLGTSLCRRYPVLGYIGIPRQDFEYFHSEFKSLGLIRITTDDPVQP